MNKDKFIFTASIIATMLITLVSGFLYFVTQRPSLYKSETVVQDKIKQDATKQTPKPEVVNYKNYEIEILNATKTKGLAKIYADKLSTLGYTKVTTGNYKETTSVNILYSPTDFKEDLEKIDFKNYKHIKSDKIKIIIAE